MPKFAFRPSKKITYEIKTPQAKGIGIPVKVSFLLKSPKFELNLASLKAPKIIYIKQSKIPKTFKL